MTIYSKRPSFIFGFHGCDKKIRDQIVSNQIEMQKSCNDYDWLGNGYYFWENNHRRAMLFAEEQQKRGKVTTPAVLGAYIDLGHCLDLLDSHYLEELRDTYKELEHAFYLQGLQLPINQATPTNNDIIIRRLDCAVIQAHVNNGHRKFDSVRGVFWEGNDLYPGAGMKEKNHIQICVRDINCIKGFFIPRELR